MGTLALGDVYSQHVQDSLVDAKTDAATQVVVQEPETSRSVPEPSYASTGVQHTTYSIPSPAVSVTAQSAVTDYSKAVDKSAFQASQFTNELQDRSGADMKQPQQSYSVEGQVPSAHQHRQEQHQPMQEQRSAFETGQHNPNASPTIPPYQHRQKQDDRSGPAGAHASHAQQPRFAGQVSTGAQTDTNTLGNQVPQVAATHATSSSGPPPGAAVVPPVRPGPTPSPHVPQVCLFYVIALPHDIYVDFYFFFVPHHSVVNELICPTVAICQSYDSKPSHAISSTLLSTIHATSVRSNGISWSLPRDIQLQWRVFPCI